MTSTAVCALCGASEPLSPYAIEAAPSPAAIDICPACEGAIAAPTEHAGHWQCLRSSMWLDNTAVQVTAYRLLKALPGQGYASEALDMLYLPPDVQLWADAALFSIAPVMLTKDANGTPLHAGDTVTLIKDLPVKGAGFTAKRGTPVRGISLTENPEHIEGKVNGQRIVIISAFVKKS